MRIRWRGLELPSRVVRDETVSTENYGRFFAEPFERGFGTTIGNAIRRILLSSLEGAAITTVRIDGVAHEFSNIDGVLDDVTDIVLNIKGVVLSLDGEGPKTMTLTREKAGDARAGDIVCDPSIRIINPDLRIATLTANVPFHVEMTVRGGRGYATANENRSPDLPLGVIPVDSVFSPVLRVRYRTEDMRVGQRTNYDRLILEIWTNGTVAPEDALVEAGLILRKHLNPFVMYYELGEDTVPHTKSQPAQFIPESEAMQELLRRPIGALNLSVRAGNCLEAAKISTIGDLVVRTDAELLRFRSFGKTSLQEVHRKLAEVGLSLGMKVPGMGPGEEPGPAAEAPDEFARFTSAGLPGDMDAARKGAAVSSPEPVQAFTMPD
jgi:DNA-directed RNA polymerase subunit alpha